MFSKSERSIEWMRLSELYKDKEMVVFSREESEKCFVNKGSITKAKDDGDFLSTVFNSFSRNNDFLLKMF